MQIYLRGSRESYITLRARAARSKAPAYQLVHRNKAQTLPSARLSFEKPVNHTIRQGWTAHHPSGYHVHKLWQKACKMKTVANFTEHTINMSFLVAECRHIFMQSCNGGIYITYICIYAAHYTGRCDSRSAGCECKGLRMPAIRLGTGMHLHWEQHAPH